MFLYRRFLNTNPTATKLQNIKKKQREWKSVLECNRQLCFICQTFSTHNIPEVNNDLKCGFQNFALGGYKYNSIGVIADNHLRHRNDALCLKPKCRARPRLVTTKDAESTRQLCYISNINYPQCCWNQRPETHLIIWAVFFISVISTATKVSVNIKQSYHHQ